MAKKDIKNYICRPYCSFYRDGVKEELICRGARVVENLFRYGTLRVTEISAVRGDFATPSTRNTILESVVCGSCDFRKDDCDFQAADSLPDAEPCGGYILLNLLIRQGVITTADLTGSNDE